MKIREALVSNSSSSSYFFNVKDLKFDDFINTMVSNYWFDYFNKNLIRGEIKKRLVETQDAHKKHNKMFSKNSKKITVMMNKCHRESVLSLKKYLANLNKCSTNKSLVEFVLKYRGIKTNVAKNGIEFSYFTSMHNDFNEGMVDLLKEIVLFFCFDTKYKTDFRRADDENEDTKNPMTKDIAVLKENFLKEMKK